MDETRSHTTVVVGIIIIVIGLGSTTGTVAGDVEVGHDEELYHDDASNFAVINELLLVEGSSITAISWGTPRHVLLNPAYIQYI